MISTFLKPAKHINDTCCHLELISSNFGKMQMVKCTKLQVAQFFLTISPNFMHESGTNFHMKKYGEIGFQKQAPYLSFAQKSHA
jgi:hypothetical protein